MTVKELIAATPTDTRIYLTWNGNRHDLDHTDAIARELFGDMVVSTIYATALNEIEADIALAPIRKQ